MRRMVEFIKACLIVVLFFLVATPFLLWLFKYVEWLENIFEERKDKKEKRKEENGNEAD